MLTTCPNIYLSTPTQWGRRSDEGNGEFMKNSKPKLRDEDDDSEVDAVGRIDEEVKGPEWEIVQADRDVDGSGYSSASPDPGTKIFLLGPRTSSTTNSVWLRRRMIDLEIPLGPRVDLVQGEEMLFASGRILGLSHPASSYPHPPPPNFIPPIRFSTCSANAAVRSLYLVRRAFLELGVLPVHTMANGLKLSGGSTNSSL
ncbi:hypothetical protein EV368DRAFT_89041 [Lentinula lateritia]|nr:hypothetical protein EV368DRAFT_89041 [Lentinula lateritia]